MISMKLTRSESDQAVAIDTKPGDGPAYTWTPKPSRSWGSPSRRPWAAS